MIFLFKSSSHRKLDNLLNKVMVYFYLVQRYFIEYLKNNRVIKSPSFIFFY